MRSDPDRILCLRVHTLPLILIPRHPDKNGGSDAAKEKFQQLSEAYYRLEHPGDWVAWRSATCGPMHGICMGVIAEGSSYLVQPVPVGIHCQG